MYAQGSAGRPRRPIDIRVISTKSVSYITVVFAVVGHVITFTLTHFEALRYFRPRRASILSQLPIIVPRARAVATFVHDPLGTITVSEFHWWPNGWRVTMSLANRLKAAATGPLLAVFVAPPAPAAEAAPDIRLERQWRVEGLANPESAALSSDGTFLYVTNVNGEGEAKDGNGFIARVSVDGKVLDREWGRGLNAPKGIMRSGDALYVADIDEMVVVDARDGGIRRRVAVPGARFLNDLAFAPDGRVLIADSQTARIYAVRSDTAEVWAENALLDSVNGLLAEPDRLVVTTMAGRLLAMDYETRVISILAEGLGDADGIAPLGNGNYLVSEWPGLLHVVARNGTHRTIIDSREQQIYLNDFLLVGDMLYQPNWEPSTLTAYRIKLSQ